MRVAVFNACPFAARLDPKDTPCLIFPPFFH